MAHPLTDLKDGGFSLANDNVFTTSEFISTTHSQSQLWPGILTVGISQGVDFSIPDQYQQALDGIQCNDSSTGADRSKRPWSVRRRPLLPYAIVEFDKSHVYAYATSGTIENPQWARGRFYYSMKFDVSRTAELILWLYMENPNVPKGSCDFFLGKARIVPMFEGEKYTKRLKVEGGTGDICVEIEYVKNTTPKMQAFDRKGGTYIGKSCESDYYDIYQAEKKDTRLLYACKTLAAADIVSVADDSTHVFLSQADKPFIAPLKYIAQTSEGLQLNSPFIHGGPLFYHLQKQRCFDIDRGRFYAAEILCAFESLLRSNASYCGPKTENILLDCVGHVVLCDFSLYHLDMVKTIHSSVEYPAPELLSNQSSNTGTSVGWWWTLGVFLYEMLTGMPPFHAESLEEIHDMIVSNEPIGYPNSLPPSAKDILGRLLDRNPEQRLGAKRGAVEVKEHPFFDCINWDKLMRREYCPAFKPPQMAMPFREPRQERNFTAMMMQFKGFPGFNEIVDWDNIEKNMRLDAETKPAQPQAAASSPTVKVAVDENQDWELVWEEVTQVFYFYSRSTNTKQPIVPQTFFTRNKSTQARDAYSSADGHILPNQIQKEAALEAALKAGYTHLIPQLLHEYGDMDLNARLYGLPGLPTALEYAAEQENIDLVELLIDEGATDELGSALFKAVRKGHQELATILVKVVNRVERTRALGRAVDRQDTAVIDILLAGGAKCDFEDFDRPPPPDGCCFPDVPENEDFMPPLVKAVRLGNMDLVRLLLAHGADVNVGYHDLDGEHRFPPPSQIIDVTCGRVIQEAMELGHRDMVGLFLDSGADIHLPQPVWQFHDCPMIPRAVYLRVTARLREVEAARQLASDSDEWVFV